MIQQTVLAKADPKQLKIINDFRNVLATALIETSNYIPPIPYIVYSDNYTSPEVSPNNYSSFYKVLSTLPGYNIFTLEFYSKIYKHIYRKEMLLRRDGELANKRGIVLGFTALQRALFDFTSINRLADDSKFVTLLDITELDQIYHTKHINHYFYKWLTITRKKAIVPDNLDEYDPIYMANYAKVNLNMVISEMIIRRVPITK